MVIVVDVLLLIEHIDIDQQHCKTYHNVARCKCLLHNNIIITNCGFVGAQFLPSSRHFRASVLARKKAVFGQKQEHELLTQNEAKSKAIKLKDSGGALVRQAQWNRFGKGFKYEQQNNSNNGKGRMCNRRQAGYSLCVGQGA